MIVDYEEKTYETYFNIELDRYGFVFSVGQVAEGMLGFDAGAYLNPRSFSKFTTNCHLRCIYRKFNGAKCSEIAKILGFESKKIPNIKFNILLQYKKPEYMVDCRAREWEYWNKSYYRYNIYNKQQNLLSKIAKVLGNRILVLYAAPAIENLNELISASNNEEIMKKTNFIKAEKTDSHLRVTYIDGNCDACLHSRMELGISFDFREFLDRREMNFTEKTQDVIEFIISSGQGIEEVLGKLHLKELVDGNIQKIGMNTEYDGEYERLYHYLLLIKWVANFIGGEWYFCT